MMLEKGEDFNRHIPDNIISIVFTDAKAPEGTDTEDVSVDKDKSVVFWTANQTMFVSTQRKGVKCVANQTCHNMFNNLFEINIYRSERKWKNIDLSMLDTGNVTDMSRMFIFCNELEIINLSGVKTDKVTDMEDMFAYCSKLEYLDISGFRTKNVTNMNSMFAGCSMLKTLNLSGISMENVENMRRMFWGCKKLDLSSSGIKNVMDMEDMFNGCVKVEELNHTVLESAGTHSGEEEEKASDIQPIDWEWYDLWL